MRILLANANTTQGVTDTVVAEARFHAAPGTEIIGATASFGVAIISTDAENAVAGHAMMGLLASHADVDAAVLATSFDTGMAGAQAGMPFPVVGMTTAALHTACCFTRRFGLVTFGAGSRSMYLDLVGNSGLMDRMAGCHTIDLQSGADYARAAERDGALLEAVQALNRDGAGAVLIAGAATAGTARRLQPLVAVPLLDGVACAVRMAEQLAGLRVRPVRPVPLVQTRPPIGLDAALAGLFAAR